MALRNNKYTISLFVLKSETFFLIYLFFYLFIYLFIIRNTAYSNDSFHTRVKQTISAERWGWDQDPFKTRRGPSRISNPSTSPPDGGNRLAVVFGDLWRSMLTRWVSGSRQDFRVDVMKESAHFLLYVWSFRGLCETGFLYRQTQITEFVGIGWFLHDDISEGANIHHGSYWGQFEDHHLIPWMDENYSVLAKLNPKQKATSLMTQSSFNTHFQHAFVHLFPSRSNILLQRAVRKQPLKTSSVDLSLLSRLS